jgi:hypothetical protein
MQVGLNLFVQTKLAEGERETARIKFFRSLWLKGQCCRPIRPCYAL